MSRPSTLTVTLSDLSKMIDHSLLHPTYTDTYIETSISMCIPYNIYSICIKPYHIPFARKLLSSSSPSSSPSPHNMIICAVIGFPHGNSTTEVKVFEAVRAVEEGAKEIDMVVNIGRVLSGKWEFVRHEIRLVNQAVKTRGARLKVIFENDYLGPPEIIKLCEICSDLSVAFVKTSTGYGFTKQENGDYNYKGATIEQVDLMRQHCSKEVQIKAAGGVRTLDDLLRMRALGVTRVGATATKEILDEARRRGIGEDRVEVDVKW